MKAPASPCPSPKPQTFAADLGRVGIFSRGIAAIPNLAELLNAKIVFQPQRASEVDVVAGWGHKPSAKVAREFAKRHGLNYLRLEDGFLRSVRLGKNSPPLSLVIDDLGIYYDARGPSRLESILNDTSSESPFSDRALVARAQSCRAALKKAQLSKYNHAPSTLPENLRSLPGPLVLVADQTFGDASVTQGLASAVSFQRMLEAALDEHPKATVLVKVHPDVVAGHKRGYLGSVKTHSRLHFVTEALAPAALLERVEHVYVVTSQLGFDALLLDKPVTCFGCPFYAGWGLTRDEIKPPRRSAKRSVDELALAAILLYPRYLDPVSGQQSTPERLIEHLSLQREMFDRNTGRVYCFGFSLWKRAFVRRYLEAPDQKLHFCRSLGHAKRRGLSHGARVVVWGQREPRGLEALARRLSLPIERMEDGFLRSVGLGSDLTAPASLVLDRTGIYYDPHHPSDLETILQDAVFTPEELTRARALRQRIVDAGLSKYNPRSNSTLELATPKGRRILFVPGQVDDDASVRLGAGSARSNDELLQQVRQHNPEAYLVFKPHPDVVSGNRQGRVSEETLRLCDQVVIDVPLAQCLELADEVHVLSSLVGFEALLRKRPVVTYGRPFYAGWGLTHDQSDFPRRRRRLSLDELVAGSLLRYPRYYSQRIRAFVRPEDTVSELLRQRESSRALPIVAPRLLRQLRRLMHLAQEVRHVF